MEDLTIEDLVSDRKVTAEEIAYVLNYGVSHIRNIFSGKTKSVHQINETALRLSKGKISFYDICKCYIEKDIQLKIRQLNQICKDVQYSLKKTAGGDKQ